MNLIILIKFVKYIWFFKWN